MASPPVAPATADRHVPVYGKRQEARPSVFPVSISAVQGRGNDAATPVPAHALQIDEDRFLILLAGSLSLSAVEKKRIFEYVPNLTQEQYDHIVRILESEKTQIDAVSRRGEKIREFIRAARIMTAFDWAEVKHGLLSKKH